MLTKHELKSQVSADSMQELELLFNSNKEPESVSRPLCYRLSMVGLGIVVARSIVHTLRGHPDDFSLFAT
jgi:hypothetical protein